MDDGKNASTGIVILLGILKDRNATNSLRRPNPIPLQSYGMQLVYTTNGDRWSVKDTPGLPIHTNSFLPHDFAFPAIGVLALVEYLIYLLLAQSNKVKVPRERCPRSIFIS